MNYVRDGIIAFALGALGWLFVEAVIAWNVQMGLPMTPNFTQHEMQQRINDYTKYHTDKCDKCLKERNDPDFGPVVTYCPEYIQAASRACVVGDWTYLGTLRDGGRLLWQYTGRPIPGWRWNVLRQCWMQDKRGDR